MSKGGHCKGWKLEGGWREGWCWAGEEAPGRGRAREPRQRSFSKSPTARGTHRGPLSRGGSAFLSNPVPQHPRLGGYPFGLRHLPCSPHSEGLCKGAVASGGLMGTPSEVRALERWEEKESLAVPTAPTLFQGAAECRVPAPRVSPVWVTSNSTKLGPIVTAGRATVCREGGGCFPLSNLSMLPVSRDFVLGASSHGGGGGGNKTLASWPLSKPPPSYSKGEPSWPFKKLELLLARCTAGPVQRRARS